MYLKYCCTSKTNSYLKFYGKITSMSLHLLKLPKFFKATIRILMETLKLIDITEKKNRS